ncbi:MAG TPA: hypothetical protein VLC93_20315 [Myxococcota bacterium]|nr:hypothetical protein [Myxococcota bacterium]
MITIKIHNATQIVEQKKGWFVANVIGQVVNMELQVEAVIMERLRATLVSEGVSATIEQVP